MIVIQVTLMVTWLQIFNGYFYKEINEIAESGEQYVPRGISYLVPMASEWRPI